ncbi:hypothetical protein GMDG_08663, partial [Pseudogymnoascus destructans 20631-21]
SHNRFTPFDGCAVHATELFAMATSPLSIDVWSSELSRCKIERSDRTCLRPSSSPHTSKTSCDYGMRNPP